MKTNQCLRYYAPRRAAESGVTSAPNAKKAACGQIAESKKEELAVAVKKRLP